MPKPGVSAAPRRSTSLRRGVFRTTPERFFRPNPLRRRPSLFTYPEYFNSDPLDDGPQGQTVNLTNTTFDSMTWIGNSFYSTPGLGRQPFVSYMRNYTNATDGFTTYRWNIPSLVSSSYIRMYVMFGTGDPFDTGDILMQVRQTDGIQAQVRFQTGRMLGIRDGTTLEGDEYYIEPLTLYRLEWTIISGGLFQLKAFSGNTINNASNGTPTFTITSPSGLTAGRSWDAFQVSPTSRFYPVTLWQADIAFSTRAMPEPLTYPVNPGIASVA